MSSHIIFLVNIKLITEEGSITMFLKNFVNQKELLEPKESLIKHQGAVEAFSWTV